MASLTTPFATAPALQVSRWFNTPAPLTLEALRGRVVVIHAFQMLCPGCVSHGLPQAAKLHRMFPAGQLAVIGLHCVFEHHAVMGPEALEVFIHEYRLEFPIAVDQPSPGGGIPLTMQALQLSGTPSIVLLDRAGRIRLEHFGPLDDLALGAVLGQLMASQDMLPPQADPAPEDPGPCGPAGCPAP